MSRKTKQNHISSLELIAQFHKQNRFLIDSFLEYLKSIDKAKTTIWQYQHDLIIFFCWNVTDNENKPFTQITKRDFTKFQGKAISDWAWSSNRMRRVKATLSSLSNYIVDILDEEEEFSNYRSIVTKIKNPVNVPVREKTIFQPEELKSVLDRLVENNRLELACMLSLAINSARRKSELTRFKVSYFTKDCIKINGLFYRTPEKVQTKGRGSKGKLLNLYVIKAPFDPYLKLWLAEMERKGIQSEWLFPKRANTAEHITDNTMDDWADQLSKLTGKSFYWHSIRHYATTQFVKIGVPDAIIQKVVGWETIDMVDDYNDMTPEEVLEEYFSKNQGVVDMGC